MSVKSLKSFEGYLLIDHSASPGTKEVPEGTILEAGVMVCNHCQVIVILNPNRIRSRNFCGKCGRYTCDNPGCLQKCTDFQQILDAVQEEAFKNLNLKEL